MRVKILLDLKDIKINVKYHSLLQGVIYHALMNNDNVSKIHDKGYSIGNRKFKLFTYSEIYGESVYLKESKELMFTDKGYFFFGSVDDNVTISFISFLQQNMSIVLGNKIIKIVGFEILDDYFEIKDEICFTTLSPITIYKTNEKRKTIYMDPSEEEFKESILSNLSQKYYLIYKENLPEVVIKEISNIKKKIVYFRNVFVIAYHFNIIFSNLNKEAIKTILYTGLGSKNSSGFGMVSINK